MGGGGGNLNNYQLLQPVITTEVTNNVFLAHRRFLQREMPMVPKMMFGVIDVRDCARAHIIAMTSTKAPGNMSFSIETNYKLLQRLLSSVFISIRVECGENTRRQPNKPFWFSYRATTYFD